MRGTLRRAPLPAVVLLVIAYGARGATAEERKIDRPADDRTVQQILDQRNAELDSLLNPESLNFDTTGTSDLLIRLKENPALLDSLNRANDGEPPALHADIRPFALTSYNRVEGLRTGLGFGASAGPLSADAAGAYGFSNHRWTGIGGVGARAGRHGPSLRLEGMDRVVPFGPNRVLDGMGLQALAAGQDRRDYMRRRGGRFTVSPVDREPLHASLSLFHYEDIPVDATTDYSLVDGDPIDRSNPRVDRGRSRGVSAGGAYALRYDLVRFNAQAGVAGGSFGGDFDYSWQEGTVTLRPVFPDGGVLNVSVTAKNTGGAPPVQERAWLGGEANLRGYDHLAFVGKQAVSGRVEYETGIDLLGRSRIPVLRDLRLQFIPFADFGSTWGQTSGVERTAGVLDGKIRNSVGIGIQKDLWLPGAKAVRFDVIRRTDGSRDPWSFWFRLVPMPEN